MYPHEVKLHGWRLWVCVVLSVLVVLLGFAGIASGAFMPGGFAALIMMGLIGGGLLLLGVAGLISSFQHKIVLHEDAIESLPFLLPARRMSREAIAGFRFAPEQWPFTTIMLVPKDAGEKPMTAMFARGAPDPVIDAWFAAISNLDAQDFQAKVDAAAEDPNFGDTPDERVQTWVSEGRTAAWIGLAGIGVAFWILVFPRPYFVVLGVGLAAVLATVLATWIRRERWSLDDETGGRPMTGGGIVMISGALALRAFLDWRFVNVWTVLGIAACVGVVAVLLLAALMPTKHRFIVGIRLLAASAFAYGALATLNGWLDDDPPTMYRTHVVEKYYESMRLAPWGPQTSATEVSTDQPFIDSLQVGGEVCVFLFPGALGLKTYRLDYCPGDERRNE